MDLNLYLHAVLDLWGEGGSSLIQHLVFLSIISAEFEFYVLSSKTLRDRVRPDHRDLIFPLSLPRADIYEFRRY